MRHKERVEGDGWGYEFDVTLPCRDDLHELTPQERLDAFVEHQRGGCPCPEDE